MPKKAIAEISDLLDSGLIMYGNDPRLEIRRQPTLIPGFDELLGGGWPAGRYTQIVGPESVGKTVLLQFAAASQQQHKERPHCLIIDLERSYDKEWWTASGVDPASLMVAQPMTGEEGIDVILAVIHADPLLGLVGVDSIGAMYPKSMIEPEKGAEQRFVGNQATMVKQFFAMCTPQMDGIIFILLNQMRATIGGYEETYPGGWAMRHNNHITLRTRREGWLLENETRVGFILEIINKKNKVGGTQGASIQIPFRFRGQIDFIQSYIDEAIERKIIINKTPSYIWGKEKFFGKGKLRQYFLDNAEALKKLEEQVSNK